MTKQKQDAEVIYRLKKSDPLTPPYAPVEVSDLEMVFPAHVVHLMPEYNSVEVDEHGPWATFQRKMFFEGLPGDVEFYLAEGIDGRTAYRHLRAIQGSFEPKHEHKEQAVAFLASIWFTKIEMGDQTYEDAQEDA